MNANGCLARSSTFNVDLCAIGCVMLGSVVLSAAVSAAVTNDRQYGLGGTGSADASLGANIGEGNPIGFQFNNEIRTADETGPGDTNTGDSIDDSGFRDLIVPGANNTSHTGATYTDTSARPLGVAGGFGARFDGVDDILTVTPLNRPDEITVFLPDYPFEYSGITARGLQMWTRPDQAGLNAGARQTIVMDTVAAGGVAITADRNWDQVNDGHASDGDIGATVAVSGDTWYHVMQHIYPSGADNSPAIVAGSGDGDLGFTSVVYVNGIAVSANNDFPDIGDFSAGDRVGLLTVGAAELPDSDGDALTAEFGEYYDGTIDDLSLYVFGDNTAQGGQNYGSFDLFSDNEWIANEIATTVPGGVLEIGDVNRDGAVTVAGDLPAFVAGWLSEKEFEGAHNNITAGDWETWGWGDMNLDGRVNLRDWALINAANPSVAAAIGAALAGVPEPTSIVLAAIPLTLAGAARRRRR